MLRSSPLKTQKKKRQSITIRKGQESVALTKEEFKERFRQRFYDPAFQKVEKEVEKVLEVAWNGYHHYRKAPRRRKGGAGFADPNYEFSVEWLETRKRILEAKRHRENRQARSRILLICGSSRSDQTCPGEMSKTFRLVQMARRVIESASKFEVDLLDLSRLTSEGEKVIYPCKACVSTAMPLCHWPCSCYPNHSLGQVNDWMAEIYPKWVAAHGVMIVTPVHWYQAPSVLKLMIDRLVCADGGNPDPSTTGGKNPQKAKELEMKGWPYPKHLAGRAFSVVVHGDAAGVDTLRRSLVDWLTDMELIQAGESAVTGHYTGYYEPYAISHEYLDSDKPFHEEVKNAAQSLVNMVRIIRSGKYLPPDRHLKDPLQK